MNSSNLIIGPRLGRDKSGPYGVSKKGRFMSGGRDESILMEDYETRLWH
jgi:hypothetical protein